MRLAPLLRLLKAHGVRSYTSEGVSITFGAPEPAKTTQRIRDTEAPPPTDAMDLAILLSGRTEDETSWDS